MKRQIQILFLLFSLGSCMKDKPEELPRDLIWEPLLAIPVGKERVALDAESGFDTTLFELDTLTNLPQWVGRVDVAMEGRIEFDLSALESATDNIKQILFRVGIRNGFPDAAMAQAYFYGNGEEAIDSLFPQGPVTLAAGTPLGKGDSIRPSYQSYDAIVGEERIPALSDAELIVLRTLLLKPGMDTSLIPFYRNYYMEAELGCMLDLKLEF